MGNYMSPDEMGVIQRLCEVVSDLYEAQAAGAVAQVSLDIDWRFPVLDGNGESLGAIGMLDDDGKFGLYFPENSEG